MCTTRRQYLWNPEEGTMFLGTGITGGCKIPDVGAGTEPWTLGRTASTFKQ